MFRQSRRVTHIHHAKGEDEEAILDAGGTQMSSAMSAFSPAAQISVFAHSLCPIACCNRFEARFIGDRLELSKYRSHVGGARAAHGRVNQHVATQEQRNLQIEDRLRALLRRRAGERARERGRALIARHTRASGRAKGRKEGRKEGRKSEP